MGKNKPTFKDVFILYKTERKQFTILTIIVLLVILGKFTKPYWYTPEKPSIEELESRVTFDKKEVRKKAPTQQARVPIDVNTNQLTDWMSLGFSEKQASVIDRYRKKINGFESISSVADIYIIDSAKFQEILPYLRIDKSDSEILSNKESKLKEVTVTLARNWKLKSFDPNAATKLELVQMGFNESEIKNIINYRTKVGLFHDNHDFQKLYAFSNEDMLTVLPFVSIKKVVETNIDSTLVQEILDLNNCDSLDLLALKGIGPYFAKLILRYRYRLGGFIDVNQLYEVPKIPKETVDLNISNFKIDPKFQPIKMNVNSQDFKMFMRHPYFSYAQTKKLFDYRNSIGKYTSLQQLKKAGYLDSEYVNTVVPYLKVD
ncbi:MAG: helix-hairpin-helix domain-containing protein [Salibacteraceae bacterium]